MSSNDQCRYRYLYTYIPVQMISFFGALEEKDRLLRPIPVPFTPSYLPLLSSANKVAFSSLLHCHYLVLLSINFESF